MISSLGTNAAVPPAPSGPAASDPAYKKALRKYLKSSRNRTQKADPDWTPFRAAEKQYKVRFPPPDLGQVLDLALLNPTRTAECSLEGWRGNPRATEWRSLKMESGSVAYAFPNVPGLVVIPSFLSHRKQRSLIRWALRDHARRPNETNLDTHYRIPPEGIWTLAHDPSTSSSPVLPREVDGSAAVEASAPGPRQLISNTPASASTFTELASQPKPPAAPSPNAQPTPPTELLPKLRWANIGWYYHWGTKQYDFSRGKEAVHPLVADLCRDVVRDVPWEEVYARDDQDWGGDDEKWWAWHEQYEPDAGIVNFYQSKDSLMAHVDRSEVCATSPLVSISLGAAAVFLIGGHTRDTPPTAIVLRSGDVVVMSGPGCRRAYHGVPRILDDTLPPHLSETAVGEDSEGDWGPFGRYMRQTRINVNVRQVFPKGFNPGVCVPPLE